MNKKEGILNMLNQAITVEHTIHPSMGTAEFFEFQLRNPYNTEHTIIIEVSDPELRWKSEINYICKISVLSWHYNEADLLDMYMYIKISILE